MKKEESEKALQAFNEELLRGMKEKREKALRAFNKAYHELLRSMSNDDHIILLGRIGGHLIGGVRGDDGDIAALLAYKMAKCDDFANVVLTVAKIYAEHKDDLLGMVGEKP